MKTSEEFSQYVERIENLKEVMGVLHWDQEVMMPEGGINARAMQFSVLSTMRHELIVDERLGELIEELPRGGDEENGSIYREIKRLHERARLVPTELINELSQLTSRSFPIWVEAKRKSDFKHFEKTLQLLIEKKCEMARCIDSDADPYEILVQDYEPYLSLSSIEEVLVNLKDSLVPLIKRIREDGEDIKETLDGDFGLQNQKYLSEDVLNVIGYDWSRGRLDTSPHPFSMGNVFDARITTRFEERNFVEGLLSTIHEFGHALYTMSLPSEHYGTPLCGDMGMIIHESQSRFWENHIGKSLAFWEEILPIIELRFPKMKFESPEKVYRMVNRVKLDNPIRVNADELTYHLHIIVRYEIESALIRGELQVSEIPSVWNEKMEKYLGITPENDSMGCLQDIHWSHGSFGYFPTYSVGSVLAAQINHHIEQDAGDIGELIRNGDYQYLKNWLGENIHSHGGKYTTPELIKIATGEDIKIDYFVEYINRKYSEMYRI